MTNQKQYPTHFQKAACWAALTGLSLVLLAVITCGVIYGLYAAFVALKTVLLPFVIAGVMAYLLHPCVAWLQSWMAKHWKEKKAKKEGGKRRNYRKYAVLLTLGATALVVGGLLLCIIPPLVEQTGQLISKREAILNNTAAATRDFLEGNETARYIVDIVYDHTPFEDAEADESQTPVPAQELDTSHKVLAIIKFYSGTLTNLATRWLFVSTRAIYGALGYLIGIVMIPLALYYFLINSGNISRKWQEVIPLPPGHFRDEVIGTLKEINNYIIAFVRGQMLVSLIDGLLLGIALTILGLPYAIPIAAAASLLGIIPYLGTILTCVPALCIAWFYWHDVNYVFAVLAIFVGVSQFDGWILQPRLLGKLVGMHDLTIMFSVLFWGSVLGGIVGALLAVPLTASIKVLLVRYVGANFGRKHPKQTGLPS